MNAIWIAALLVGIPLSGYILYKLVQTYNSPGGEQRMKMRTQGSFVPLGRDDDKVKKGGA